jgi:hypothetical protein
MTHENGEDWIEVRANLSKKQMDTILRNLPEKMTSGAVNGIATVTFSDVSDMARDLFTNLMVGWSLDVPCTFENYQNLDNEAATWVDSKLYEHFAALQTSTVEKGKAQTSRKG